MRFFVALTLALALCACSIESGVQWSPDSSTLLYSDLSDDAEGVSEPVVSLYSFNFSHQDAPSVLVRSASGGVFSFSGEEVAYIKTSEQGRGLSVINLKTKEITSLIDASLYDVSGPLGWLKNDVGVVCALRSKTVRKSIWRIASVSTNGEIKYISAEAEQAREPSVDKAGERVAFTVLDDSGIDKEFLLKIATIGEDETVEIFRRPPLTRATIWPIPRWRNGLNEIVWLTKDSRDVLVLNVRGHSRNYLLGTRNTPQGADVVAMRISTDGAYLYHTMRRERTLVSHRMDLDTGDVRELSRAVGQGRLGAFSTSPDKKAEASFVSAGLNLRVGKTSTVYPVHALEYVEDVKNKVEQKRWELVISSVEKYAPSVKRAASSARMSYAAAVAYSKTSKEKVQNAFLRGYCSDPLAEVPTREILDTLELLGDIKNDEVLNAIFTAENSRLIDNRNEIAQALSGVEIPESEELSIKAGWAMIRGWALLEASKTKEAYNLLSQTDFSGFSREGEARILLACSERFLGKTTDALKTLEGIVSDFPNAPFIADINDIKKIFEMDLSFSDDVLETITLADSTKVDLIAHSRISINISSFSTDIEGEDKGYVKLVPERLFDFRTRLEGGEGVALVNMLSVEPKLLVPHKKRAAFAFALPGALILDEDDVLIEAFVIDTKGRVHLGNYSQMVSGLIRGPFEIGNLKWSNEEEDLLEVFAVLDKEQPDLNQWMPLDVIFVDE